MLALAISVSAANGQPVGFSDDFSNPTLDPAFEARGDLAGHPAVIAGTYDLTDPFDQLPDGVPQPGVSLFRQTTGTLSSYTHEVDLILGPFGSPNTQTDVRFRTSGADGLIEVVLNSFGSIRLFHNNTGAGPGNNANLQPPPGDPAINIDYNDGDLLNLTSSYDAGTDTIDVSFAINGGSPVTLFSGTGNAGSIGDVITNFVEIQALKFNNAIAPDQAVVAIDSWSLTTGNIIDPPMGLICDGDGDGDCDQDDINALYAAFGGGGQFDLDGSQEVDAADIGLWLAEASSPDNPFNTGNSTFVIGDVDLDGSVGSGDLGLLLNNFNSTTALNWGNGNLNGDGMVDSGDLGLLLNNFNFTSAAAQAVPEPGADSLLLLALMGFIATRPKRDAVATLARAWRMSIE